MDIHNAKTLQDELRERLERNNVYVFSDNINEYSDSGFFCRIEKDKYEIFILRNGPLKLNGEDKGNADIVEAKLTLTKKQLEFLTQAMIHGLKKMDDTPEQIPEK